MQTQAWLQRDYDRILILYAMKQFQSNTNKWNSAYILLGIWDVPEQNLMAIKEHVILLPKSFFFPAEFKLPAGKSGYLKLHKKGWGIFFFFC